LISNDGREEEKKTEEIDELAIVRESSTEEFLRLASTSQTFVEFLINMDSL